MNCLDFCYEHHILKTMKDSALFWFVYVYLCAWGCERKDTYNIQCCTPAPTGKFHIWKTCLESEQTFQFQLYFIKRYLDLIMYILDKINHNVERQEMLSKLSEQLLSGREYKTVMVFRQSNVKHDVHVYTILANRANYKHYLTAGKPN